VSLRIEWMKRMAMFAVADFIYNWNRHTLPTSAYRFGLAATFIVNCSGNESGDNDHNIFFYYATHGDDMS
jgi:hypothetical protein